MRKSFSIEGIKEPKRTKDGQTYVEGKTNDGKVVAFWGLITFLILRKIKFPCEVSCVCKNAPEGVKGTLGHDFWVNERFKMFFTPIPADSAV